MKTIKIANKEYIFAEIPDDASNFTLEDSDGITYDSSSKLPWGFIDLEKAMYEIITTTNTITEETFETVCPDYFLKTEDGDKLYRNYKTGSYVYDITWEASFYSLMGSLELDRSKNYLLIEKL